MNLVARGTQKLRLCKPTQDLEGPFLDSELGFRV